MGVIVVAGGQFGSEGKGKLVAHIAVKRNAAIAVRCGGPNAGHTLRRGGRVYTVRQVPTAFVNPGTKLYLAAGAVIDPVVFLDELTRYGIDPRRVGIDPFTAVITDFERAEERRLGLGERISSTLTGTGAATARKVLRHPDLKLARDAPELRPFLVDVAATLNEAYDRKQDIIVEGTQGWGLSLHHGGFYPHVTSRDTTPSAFLSEAGLSPFTVTDIILVFRTFPIRVHGEAAGPLKDEVTWGNVQSMSRAPHPLIEYTTVTRQVRRVARFDFELAKRAVQIVRPSRLAIHGLDYVNYADHGKTHFDDLSQLSRDFIAMVESTTQVKAGYLFTGEDDHHLIDLD